MVGLSVRRDKAWSFIPSADLLRSYFLNFCQALQLFCGRVCDVFPVLKIAVDWLAICLWRRESVFFIISNMCIFLIPIWVFTEMSWICVSISLTECLTNSPLVEFLCNQLGKYDVYVRFLIYLHALALFDERLFHAGLPIKYEL